ncbi:hypothetical protein Dsin_028505 [Dipteronia sinensis]|uniref:SWIM-type domain-containing protein n=1 Tax=Dipteronia sinensis TaxID=43782 RepID=A0AAD9ZQZ6_9ROSI|nr:hypothetical protein Dsin_028505 [Dipteronia sinensis]
MNTLWTVTGSELYSIKAIRSVDLFEKPVDQVPIYKGQMFKENPTLKRAVGSYAFTERFEYMVSRSSNTQFTAEWNLFESKFGDPERSICPKDIVYEMREHYGIHLLYNKAYRLKEHALNQARTMGVLLVVVCKDRNEMIYTLAFGFANSECTESWTWFLKKLCKVIQYSDRVMLVSDRDNVISNAMKSIFLNVAHGICAYHLAQNLKRFCKQRDDVIWLYYRAMYVYCIKEFDRAMAELKETYCKVDDKWKETTVDLDKRSCLCRQWDLDKLSCSHAMAVARFKGVSINAQASNLYTTGFLKHAYEMGVNLIPDPEFRDIPDAIRNRFVLPWKKKNLPRKPKKLRIPSAGEKRKLQSVFKV